MIQVGLDIKNIQGRKGLLQNDVPIEDKSILEKTNLIAKWEEANKHAVFRVIDSMLTRYDFKDFFNKNMAAL